MAGGLVIWASEAETGRQGRSRQPRLTLELGRCRLIGEGSYGAATSCRPVIFEKPDRRALLGAPSNNNRQAAATAGVQCTDPGGVILASCPMASLIRRQTATPASSPSAARSSARLALSASA
jgi:hypothetical protein